jgi:hypothetical protein
LLPREDIAPDALKHTRVTVPAPIRCALAAAAAAVAASGCGGHGATTIDHVTLEKAIEVSVAQQRHQIVIVACPKGVKAKKGVTFTCTATTAKGRQYPFRVTGRDDKGNVHYVGLNARSTP